MIRMMRILAVIAFLCLVVSCGGGGDGEQTDYYTPRVESSFFLSSDDGILNAYGYELGLNTISVLEPNWRSIESEEGTYDFSSLDLNDLLSYNGYKLLRVSLFDRLWSKEAIEDSVPTYVIEMLFGQPTVPDSYQENDDLHLDEKPEVFEAYFDFLEALLTHIRALGSAAELDMILLEVEFNSWTVSTRYGNTNGADYLKALTERIRPYLPDARVGVLLASTELSSSYVPDPDSCPGGDARCQGNGPEYVRLGVSQYVQKMVDAGVDFDIIGLRFTPDFWEDTATLDDYKPFIDTVSEFGKDIFAWAVWFAADSSGTEGNLPHSEALQSEEFIGFMQTNLDNPLVIGVDVSLFDVEESGVRKDVGMVDALNSQKDEAGLTLREAYTDFQTFWEANHPL